MKSSCKYCHAKTKRLANYMGYPGVCNKHLRLEIAKER